MAAACTTALLRGDLCANVPWTMRCRRGVGYVTVGRCVGTVRRCWALDTGHVLSHLKGAPPFASSLCDAKRMQTYQVSCPAGVAPGQTFQANVGGRVIAVRVPPNGSPGMLMNIQVPAVPAAPTPAAQPGQAQIRIPAGVGPGQQIRAQVGGQTVQVTVPAGYSPGMLLTVKIPGAAAAPTPYTAPAPQHRPPPRAVAPARPAAAAARPAALAAALRPAVAPKPKPAPARSSPPRQSSLLDSAVPPVKKKPQAVAHPPTNSANNNGEISALWFLNMGI